MQDDGKTKVPYYIHANDQDIFAFAGLWDLSKSDAGDRIESVTHNTASRRSWRRKLGKLG